MREHVGATSLAYLSHDGLVGGDAAAGLRSLPRLPHRRLPDRGPGRGREAPVRACPRRHDDSLIELSGRWRFQPRDRQAVVGTMAAVQLFHYHLVTSRVREVEARYIGKLAFDLVARHGRIGEELTSYEPGVAWNELDAMGFKLRLTELEKGAVNVVVQPGQWPTPRVDHLGFVLDEDEFDSAIERAEQNDLRVQEHGGRRTFVSTNAGYRLELHPPREWIHELLAQGDELQLSELHLKADDPSGKAKALAAILDADRDGTSVEVGATVVRFVRGGPQGRPELYGELFV